MTRPTLLPRLLTTSAAVSVTAALGSLATVPGVRSESYQRLDKPAWQPPAQVFPIAWTGLYATIAGSSAVALTSLARRRERTPRALRTVRRPWRRRQAERPSAEALRRRSVRLRRALGLNLVLNAGWCWTFFRWQRLDVAVVNAAALAVSSADLARRVGAEHRTAGAWLVPYALWCTFATALTTSIAARNPRS